MAKVISTIFWCIYYTYTYKCNCIEKKYAVQLIL